MNEERVIVSSDKQKEKIVKQISKKLPINEIRQSLYDLNKYRMVQDFEKGFSYSKVDEIARTMDEFIGLALRKEYLTEENIYSNLKKFIFDGFKSLPQGTNISGIVRDGDYAGTLCIDPNTSDLKHTVFHEMSRAMVPVFSISPEYKDVISRGSIKFLKEIAAESTACDIDNGYIFPKNRSLNGLMSDWKTPYSRDFQELGYDFLSAIPYYKGIDERPLFRKFTKDGMKSTNTILDDIAKSYQEKYPETWKEDLSSVTTLLGKFAETKKLSKDEFESLKGLLRKYKLPRGFEEQARKYEDSKKQASSSDTTNPNSGVKRQVITPRDIALADMKNKTTMKDYYKARNVKNLLKDLFLGR